MEIGWKHNLPGVTAHVLVWCAVMLLGGCCALEQHRSRDSGFLPYSSELSRPKRHLPFDYAYVPDPERLDRLRLERSNVCVLPVDTRIVEGAATRADLPPSWVNSRITDYRALGSDFFSKLQSALRDPTLDVESISGSRGNRRFDVVDTPNEDSLVWELAIVDVSPNLPVVSVLATFANYFMHGTALVRALGAGSVTIEGILRDGKTGDPLLLFRDRASDKISLFSVRNYTVYGHSRRAFTEWSSQVTQLTYAPMSYDVPGAWIFTFNPF